MFQRVRKHINPTTILAFTALIFAVTSGAFAATGTGSGSHQTLSATVAKAKPKSKTGPRGPAGPKGTPGTPGAAGPAGPTGPTGAQGPAGAAGAKGENGAAGTQGAAGPQGPAGPEGAEGNPGATGSPWTAGGTLPSGATETGTWAVRFEGTEEGHLPIAISFSVPLAKALSGHVFYIDLEEQNKENGQQPPAECQGTAAAPTAVKGNLCVYLAFVKEPEPRGLRIAYITPPTTISSGEQGAGTSGAIANAFYEAGTGAGAAVLQGTWAVTG